MAKPSTHAAHKPRGLSLHVGLNRVDPKHYGGWSGPLAACEADAKDMAAIAAARGIASTMLLSAEGTRSAVLAGLRKAAKALKAGDLFFLSYSGHGGQIPDSTSAPDEADRLDETWCLYDGQLIDDELYAELGRFARGVRILVLSDSCHSGTVTRARPEPLPAGQRSKLMPADVAERVYREHRAFYDGLQADAAAAAKAAVADPDAALAALATTGTQYSSKTRRLGAEVILIAGCQDKQTSLDGDHNGAFTAQLRKVWHDGRFEGNHTQFHARIVAGMPKSQTPNLLLLGDAAAFAAQTPLTL